MNGDNITLYCLVRGDLAEYAFHVDIPRNHSVSHLKEAIKEKSQPRFDHFAARYLRLWRINIPVSDKATFLELASDKPKKNTAKLLGENSLADPTCKIHDVFLGEPADKHIHVVVDNLKETITKTPTNTRRQPFVGVNLRGDNGESTHYQEIGKPKVEVPEYQLTATLPSTEPELILVDVVTRKVRGLLNKLTLEKFETISNQIIEFANKSVKETDSTALKVVAQLILEHSTNEPNYTFMYAQLARKTLDKVSNDIKDDNVKDSTGKVITGGDLFRKYLLNRCQEGFERGWKGDLPKVDKNEDGTVAAGVDPLLTEEYYIAAKAKRRGLGLVKFVGELFKLRMLTERIMHECIKKLLSNVADPEGEETESLCMLMTIVGMNLDLKKAKGWMDVYFDRMGDLLKNPKLPCRIKFMIQDVIDLRSSRWVPRRNINAPKTIQEILDDRRKTRGGIPNGQEHGRINSNSNSNSNRHVVTRTAAASISRRMVLGTQSPYIHMI